MTAREWLAYLPDHCTGDTATVPRSVLEELLAEPEALRLIEDASTGRQGERTDLVDNVDEVRAEWREEIGQ